MPAMMLASAFRVIGKDRPEWSCKSSSVIFWHICCNVIIITIIIIIIIIIRIIIIIIIIIIIKRWIRNHARRGARVLLCGAQDHACSLHHDPQSSH